MAEGAEVRVQRAIKEFVNEVDKNHLRALEKDMHLCAAKCCDTSTGTIEDVHRCVERCQDGTMRAQKFVQSELERFQDGLSRCVLQCQDEIKDKVTPSTTDAEIEVFRSDFEKCAISCCDNSVAKLPSLSKRVIDTLRSNRY